jgi:hypothetical protein
MWLDERPENKAEDRDTQRPAGWSFSGCAAVGATAGPHGVTQDAQRPSTVQPSSTIFPVVQSRMAQTGSVRLSVVFGQAANERMTMLVAAQTSACAIT